MGGGLAHHSAKKKRRLEYGWRPCPFGELTAIVLELVSLAGLFLVFGGGHISFALSSSPGVTQPA